MATSTEATILTKGKHATLRIWSNEEPSNDMAAESRPYETLGYVIAGAMEVRVGGKTTTVTAGDSYYVPSGAEHSYVITERLTAIEAIAPGS